MMNMKRHILISIIISLLSACSNTELDVDQSINKTQEIRTTQKLEQPDITTSKEWDSSLNCDPVKAKSLIGHTDLTREQILSMSNAKVYRSVSPTEAVTDDLRLDRVTIIIDPKTKRIIGSDCG